MGKILARYIYHDPVPGKLFLFDIGVEVFGNTLDEQVRNAGAYARQELSFGESLIRDTGFLFTIGFIWGNLQFRNPRVIDLYGYSGSGADCWESSNLEVTMWVIRESDGEEGYWEISEPMASCESSLIVLGKEAVHRRRTRNLGEYVNSHVYLMEMEPSHPYGLLDLARI
ncbi:hypothetical protein HY500_01845 [Candidatus Woesearchaeota archaeon]|nr:hypothetical protein [Candidatus Woesearchaeota archaeon]